MNYNEAYEYISAAMLNAQLPFPVSEKMKEATFDRFVTEVGLRSLSKKKVEIISSFTDNVGTILSKDFTGKIYKVESTSSTSTTDTDVIRNMGYWVRQNNSDYNIASISSTFSSDVSTLTVATTFPHNFTSGQCVKIAGVTDLTNTANQNEWDLNINDKAHYIIVTGASEFQFVVYNMANMSSDAPESAIGYVKNISWGIYLNKAPGSNIKVYYYATPNTRSRSDGQARESKRISLYDSVDLESEELCMAALHYSIGSLIAFSGDEKRSTFHMQAGGAQEKAYMDTKKYMEANYDIIPSPLKDFV